MKSSCRSPLVVDRVTERAKLAHGSGAVDMTTANIAEVLKLAAKTVPYDNDEKTWLEFRAKLENYLTMVDEVRGASAGRRVSSNGETSIRSTKLETGAKRCRTEVGSRRGDSWWRRRRRKRKIAMLQAVLQPGMSDNLAKFEETWKSWEHQVDVYENLSSSKLDDDVKISVVLRQAPQKLRDHLLVNPQQWSVTTTS